MKFVSFSFVSFDYSVLKLRASPHLESSPLLSRDQNLKFEFCNHDRLGTYSYTSQFFLRCSIYFRDWTLNIIRSR